MSQAIMEELLRLELLDDNAGRYTPLRERFAPAITSLRENLPPLLKYFHEWKNIKPTRTAIIMKEQFHINRIRREVCEIEEARHQFFEKVKDFRRELRLELSEEKRKCQENQECKTRLDAHMKTCRNGCTPYTNYCVDNDNNGRCKHYMNQRRLQERLDNYDNYENDLDWEYAELRYDLKRALRIQKLGGTT